MEIYANNSSLLFLYLIGLLAIGLYSVRNTEKSVDEYFSGGYKIGWVMLAASVFLSNIFRFSILGLSISIISLSGLILLSIALLIAGSVIGLSLNRHFHLPVLLLNSSTGNRILAVAGIVFYVSIQLLSILFVSTIVLEQVAGGDFYSSSVVIIAVAGIFVVVGGQSSLMRTQMIQLLIVLGAISILFFTGLGSIRNVWREIFALTKPVTDHVSIVGAAVGLPLIGYWFWNIDHFSASQISIGRTIREQYGALIAALGLTAAVALLVYFQKAPILATAGNAGDGAHSWTANAFLVAGSATLILGALAGTFSSISSLFTFGLYRSIKSSTSGSELVLVGRLTALTVCVLAILLIPFARVIGGIMLPYFFLVQVYFCAPIVALSLMKKSWPRQNGNADLYALLSGELFGLLFFCLDAFSRGKDEHGFLAQADPFIIAMISFVLTGIVYVLMSMTGVQRHAQEMKGSVTATRA